MTARWTLRRVGRMAWHAVTYELAIYRALLRWLVRRPEVPAGATAVGYARLVTPVMWLWIFASAAEVPAAHFLLPWEGARLVLLGIGVWGLVWMLGALAALHVRPHLVDGTGLRVRNGPLTDVPVGWAEICAVRAVETDLDSTIRSRQVLWDTLHIGVSGRTNVRLALHGPRTVTMHTGEHEVAALALWVDQPRDFVAMVQRRLTPVS